MNISDEDLRKIVKEVAGEDPFWNIPVYDVVRKIIDLPQGADFGIGDLINPDYNISTMSPKMQKDFYDSVIEVCKKINIDLLETSPEIRMNEHSFTWALTKKSDNSNDENITGNIEKDEKEYRFYKDKITNKTWWVDNRGVKGEMLFTFDKKKIYNLFRDYPYELSSEEIEIFDRENPYWADFFKDRKQTSEDNELEKIKEDVIYEKRKIDEYIEKEKNEAVENQRKLEIIKKYFFEDNTDFFDEIKMYLNETLDYDILNNPSDNCLRFEIFDKRKKKKMFFAINENMFVLNDISEHKLNLRGDSSNEIFSSLISELEDITKEWNLCYSNAGEYYWGITICKNNKCNLYVGNSSFPNNWSQFIEIINNVIKNLMYKTNDEVKRIYLNQTEQ